MTAAFAIARAFLGKLPWQVWAGVAVLGIALICYSKGYGDARDKYRRQMAELTASVEAAQEQARAAQVAVNEAEQARLDAITKEADHAHETTRIVVRDATDRFIADRVQDRQCVASGTDSPATGAGAGSAQDVSRDAVMVDASDVRLFGEWVAYGMTCNQFVNGLASAPE